MPSKRKGSPASESSSKAWGELRRHKSSTWEEGPEVFYLEGTNCNIGRVASRGIDIVVDLTVISSKHCTLEPGIKLAGGQLTCTLSDHSTNGTFVEGGRVGRGNRVSVTEGMTVSMGKVLTTKKKQKWEIPVYTLVLHDNEHNPAKKPRNSPGRTRTDASATLQRNNDQLREDLMMERKKNTQLKKEITVLQYANNDENGKGGSSASASKTGEAAALGAEVERLKDELKKSEGVADSHKDEAKRQASRAQTAEQKVEKYEQQLLEREKEHGMATTETEHLQTRTKEMEHLLATHKQELETATTEASALRLKVTELNETITRQNKAMDTATQEVARFKASEASLTQMMHEHKDHADGVRKTLETTRSGFTTLQQQYDHLQTKHAELVTQQEKTATELKAKIANLKHSGAAMNKMTVTLKGKEKTISGLGSDVERLTNTLNNTQQRLISFSEREEIQRQRAENTRNQIEESLPGLQKLLSHLTDAAKMSEVDAQSQKELLSPSALMMGGTQPDIEEEGDEEDEEDEEEDGGTNGEAVVSVRRTMNNIRATQHQQGTDVDDDDEDDEDDEEEDAVMEVVLEEEPEEKEERDEISSTPNILLGVRDTKGSKGKREQQEQQEQQGENSDSTENDDDDDDESSQNNGPRTQMRGNDAYELGDMESQSLIDEME